MLQPSMIEIPGGYLFEDEQEAALCAPIIETQRRERHAITIDEWLTLGPSEFISETAARS